MTERVRSVDTATGITFSSWPRQPGGTYDVNFLITWRGVQISPKLKINEARDIATLLNDAADDAEARR
jgi:hypothetical protein